MCIMVTKGVMYVQSLQTEAANRDGSVSLESTY